MTPPTAAGFLVRLPAGAGAALGVAGARRVRAAGVEFELDPLFTVRGAAGGVIGLAPAPLAEWHIARAVGAPDSARAWDAAHALATGMGLTAATTFVEPDFLQDWPYQNAPGGLGVGAAGDACAFNDQIKTLPNVGGRFAWHLANDFSQLAAARSSVPGSPGLIRIAHLDTGYDSNHQTFVTPRVRKDLQRNFVNDQAPGDAHDPATRGLLKNPGHGTGTLGILAGGRFACHVNGYAFDDVLGGAPDAEIVPVRVGNSVVQLQTSTVAGGINYAIDLCASEATRIHVISMSMGGLASAAWADAVNMAYDAGIIYVAAAGNNFSAGFFGFPTHLIVHPARFRRVIAACGVMANRAPYYDLPFKTMQGNWGPGSKMATAISAYTPNMPWAELGCAGIVDMDGCGTSAATPQVAATVALYLRHHAHVLFDRAKYPDAWMRVEAVRQALFTKADKSADGGSMEKLGNGLVRALDAIGMPPPVAAGLHKTDPDTASFPLLRVLTGLGVTSSTTDAMLALEATQLAARWTRDDKPNPMEGVVLDPDLPADAIAPGQVRRFLEAIIEHPDASSTLKQRAEAAHQSLGGPGPAPTPPTAPRSVRPAATESLARPFVPPLPAFRALRGYAIDPSLTTELNFSPVSEIVFKIPWEALEPGPVGEYLEVIDADPASRCFYEPVNLDDPILLAQNGLPPSEGVPQFHQQMVYAVASLTIRNFERALGRHSLWRPGPPPPTAHPKNDSVFVRRLRIYPHALREANAYYSPNKIALLFGYFQATANEPSVPGGFVFTALSHDIVAHETTHALLDGMHRQFLLPTNPDVRAFHEGFADIVSLLQHFTFEDILQHQIASTRGSIRDHESLLGQLAGQFGRATGLRGALRDAIGRMDPDTHQWVPHPPDPAEYEATLEPHDRGAILVAAVFDAFLGIYERRTADLLRLATGGSGVLQPGAIHPDLVARLCAEAAKTAQHVLTMCIRALDYCPPTDITFGEFLRAVITADVDAVPNDDLRYRVAFIEAFRKRGLYPRDLRTLSEQSLIWRTPKTDEIRPSLALQDGLRRLQPTATKFLFAHERQASTPVRETTFHLEREMRRYLHEWLKEHFTTHEDGRSDAAFFGIDPRQPFEVHTARFALRPGADGDIDPVFLMVLLQTGQIPIDPADPSRGTTPFEGGATIVVDMRTIEIRYCIRKHVDSVTRQDRQRAFENREVTGLRSLYFGAADDAEPFAVIHRRV